MEIWRLRSKYRSDFIPLNLYRFANGSLQTVYGPWAYSGGSINFRTWLEGNYTQNLDNGTTTITVNGYQQLYAPYPLISGRTSRYLLNSGIWGTLFEVYRNDVWYSQSGYWNVLYGTSVKTLYCKSDGSFDQVNLQAYSSETIEETSSGSLTGTSVNYFPTMPSKIGNVSNFNENDTITVPITRFNDVYRKKLTILINDVVIKEIDNITTDSLSITFSNSELQTIYANSTDTNTPIITFKLETFTGDNFDVLYYTSQSTPTCTLLNTQPTISNVTYSNSTSSISGDNVVSNISNITISCDISLQKSATLVSAKCNGNDMSLVSGNTYSVTLSKQNTTNFVIEIVDSRGNVVTQTITKTLINYISLSQDGSFRRTSNTSGKVLLDYSGNFWSGNFGISNNALSVCWNYREKGASTWEDGTCIANTIIDSQNNKYSNSEVSLNTLLGVNDNFFDYTKDYEFQLIVEDLIQQIVVQYSLTKGIPNTAWYEDGYMYRNGDIDITGDYKQNGQSIITPVVDNLESTSSTSALSANQGRILGEEIDKSKKYSFDETIVGHTEYNVTKNNVQHTIKLPIYRKKFDTIYPSNKILLSGIYEIVDDGLWVYANFQQWFKFSSSGLAGDNYRNLIFLYANKVHIECGSYYTAGTSPLRGWLEYTKVSDYDEAYNKL